MKTIVKEKLDQAVDLLNEQDIDCWVTFVRETSQTHDPALDLLLGFGLTWVSAIVITRHGEKIAIVGRYDVDNVQKLEAYDRVLGYDISIRELLTTEIKRIEPQTIALNYSLSDSGADGLTHGMWLKLRDLLGEPYANRFVSGEGIARRLRERKSPAEIARIRSTIKLTEQMYEALFDLPLSGMTEVQVHAIAGEYATKQGVAFGWERINCPMVNAGEFSSIGHGIPDHIKIEPGMIVHFDMGLQHDDYCSDLQRDAYVLREGETAPPPEVQRAWDACWAALEAGRAVLQAGVPCWTVDKAARDAITGAGYAEFLHAFGHHVGRKVHDGGSVLGPHWEKYGDLPNALVEPNSVYAIELGVLVPGYGYIGIEENVLVSEAGAEYLSEPQRTLILI
jgi:Xaa-Pro aminopeptidase